MAEKSEASIRVTLEDLAKLADASTQPAPMPRAAHNAPDGIYGNISTAATDADPVITEEKGSFLLQGWFYLGAAGLIGAIAGWGICEPAFIDGPSQRWGNTWMIPMVTIIMLISFAVAESIVERSWKKAAIRLAMVVPLGVVFGFLFNGVAEIIYGISTRLVIAAGVETYRNPGWWIARATAWAGFGIAAGLSYGLVGKSGRKAKYGVIGGAVGAFVGGLAFDPISILVHGGAQSRAFGFALLGLAAGSAMGFVESALKDRWLYVSAGPLAGKQFILYKHTTTIGSDQASDIYLFKDSSIAPRHATIELRGTQATITSQALVFVSGVPVRSRVLLSGDLMQIGRYSFKYNERHR